jgi:hypothetical protein
VATYERIDEPTSRRDLSGIEVVRWPAQQRRRAELADGARPVVLLVEPTAPPPRCDEHEDWLREPATTHDLQARMATLQDRLSCSARLTFEDGILVHRGAWVAVPEAQVAPLELLLARYGCVVAKDHLAAVAHRNGSSGDVQALKTMMLRLTRRVRPIGVTIRAIRGRGYLLHLEGSCPVHPPGGAER